MDNSRFYVLCEKEKVFLDTDDTKNNVCLNPIQNNQISWCASSTNEITSRLYKVFLNT